MLLGTQRSHVKNFFNLWDIVFLSHKYLKSGGKKLIYCQNFYLIYNEIDFE